MKQLTLLTILLFPTLIFGQDYCIENEQILFEFKTNNNKILVIAKDNLDKYLVYRYGTKDCIEFEYPNERNKSWKKFKFSSYLRGGGIRNEGMDLNYLYFQTGNYKYVVYQEYIAQNGETDYGIKVINLKTGKTTNIKAETDTTKGTLTDFRNNKKIGKGDELFL